MKNTTEINYLPQRVLEAVNRVFAHGAEKHGGFGWGEQHAFGPKGVDHQIDKALGHIGKWDVVGDLDEDSGENHLAHAISRLIIAFDMELRDGPQRTEGTGEGVSQTSTVSDYIQKEVAAWKEKTGRD